MAAFNWVVIDSTCPVCRNEGRLRCQTHVASDYDGDITGRFHDREYHLNERMRWWPEDDVRYENWRVNGEKNPTKCDQEHDVECCLTKCPKCFSELYAVIRFERQTPVEILEIGQERDWPVLYCK